MNNPKELKIIIWPNEILVKKCTKVDKKDRRTILDKANQIYQLMLEHDGAAIAAPQVGILQRFFIIRHGLMAHHIIINPRWKPAQGAQKSLVEEGCLSFPNITRTVERFSHILVDYEAHDGRLWQDTLKGFPAQVFQHETDHLNGKLFTDISLNS